MIDAPGTSQPAESRDPRAVRTREAVIRAATDLAGRGEPITMRRLAEEAGVSRSSLYAQFAALDDVAVMVLSRSFEQIGEADVLARAQDGAEVAPIAFRAATRLAEHIDERRTFYRSALDWAVSMRGHDVLEERYAAIVAASLEVSDPAMDADERDDLAVFVAGGALSLIRRWLRSDRPVTAEQMAARLVAAMPESVVGGPHQRRPGGPAPHRRE